MSVLNFKQKINLYNKTFLTWNPTQIITTLQKSTIEASLHAHNFNLTGGDKDYANLCESLSNIEVMTEVLCHKFPSMRHDIQNIKKIRLGTLRDRTKNFELLNKLKNDLESLGNDPDKFKYPFDYTVKKIELTNKIKSLEADLYPSLNVEKQKAANDIKKDSFLRKIINILPF